MKYKSDLSSAITQSVIIARQNESMEGVIRNMIDEQVSSILVADPEDNIVGIITERDIVRKFTLLSKADKLKSKVITVMTRPVQFVSIDNLNQDIELLHKQMKVRHFPILMDSEPTIQNLAGMLTSTDLFRIWLKQQKKSSEPLPQPEVYKISLIMAGVFERAKYKKMFETLPCQVDSEGAYIELVQNAQKESRCIIFDLDSQYGEAGNNLLTLSLCSGTRVIFLTKRLNIAQEFRKKLRNPLHNIMIKPIDLSFLDYLLSSDKGEKIENF